MKAIIGGKLYDTDKAEIIASDEYWDGRNWDRNGRNTFLYKTKKGRFFLHRTSRWQGELDEIIPISIEGAKKWYEKLPKQVRSYKEAFGEEPEEA